MGGSGKREKKKNTKKRELKKKSKQKKNVKKEKSACSILLRCFGCLDLEEICYFFIRIINVIVTFYCFIERT